MALSLRGWGPTAFREASPDFLAAARWAMVLEAVMPHYRAAQQALAVSMPSDSEGKRQVALAKISAQKFLDEWTPILFPGDEG